MNLDNLISKYLDGELSASEDAELRRLLSEDPAAKEQFDAHILIHSAMKEDAKNIKPSMNLVGKTEDKILSRIMTEQPEGFAYVPRKRIRPVLAFASLTAVLIIFGVLSIGDYYFAYGTGDISEALKQEKIRINRLAELEKLGISSNLISEPEEILLSAPVESNSSLLFASADNIGLTSVSNNIVQDYEISSAELLDNESSSFAYGGSASRNTSSSRSVVELNDYPLSVVTRTTEGIEVDYELETVSHAFNVEEKEVINSSNLSSGNNSGILANLDNMEQEISLTVESPVRNFAPNSTNTYGQFNQYDYYYGKPSQINLTTFLGNEIAQGGFNAQIPKVISNFSQSIGYKLSETQQFGLDIGFTQYSYDETKVGRIPNKIDREPDYMDMNKVEVKEVGPSSGDYIEFPYVVNSRQQMMWGAAFYDRKIIDAGGFALSGRIALGATNKGPLGYGRMYLKYNIFKRFSLNLGVDGRAFWWENPAFGENSSNIKTSLSIIYGFEIKI